MQLLPPYLVPGDTVYLLSTARSISLEECQPAIDFWQQKGISVIVGETIGKVNYQFAGPDELRLSDFQRALDNPDIKAILCARGGYGTVRIMDYIDWNRFVQHPKWIVGYSDVTYLLNHVSNYFGIASLHATMPINYAGNSAEAVESLYRTITGKDCPYHVPAHPLNRAGQAIGDLTGGNLSILHNMTGTPSGVQTHGKILFLEDLDEYLYHVDRMMMNLKRAGKLEGLSGLLVGGFTEIKDNTIPFGYTAEEIILEHVAAYNYPVCFGFPAGHVPDNQALCIGRKMELIVTPENHSVQLRSPGLD
jgi:muramoyltetrapeptide carboxypeptidase